MNTNYSTKTNLTTLSENGMTVRKIILSNNEMFYSFAKALGAVNEIFLFLIKFDDPELDRAYYGKEMKSDYVGQHAPVIDVREDEHGTETEVVIPWAKAKLSKKANFETPIEKLFQKVLDIVVRSFVKASFEFKAAEGFSLLTAPIYPKIVTIEDALRLAAEIENFRKDYLI